MICRAHQALKLRLAWNFHILVQGDSRVFSRQSTGVKGQSLACNATRTHCHSLCTACMIPIRVPELAQVEGHGSHAHAPKLASPRALGAGPALTPLLPIH
ncbi:hypothetical protein BDA96_06G256400 [Sorghum bicolor]|uniref:Uncharacterized protein n=2 Tax=Sorghum bicolor TaxID=4558 RepID=A0A921UE83_SORBI|nr:hypothetical protein BDA96_06G256400 [Sorghum bicolor]OQU82416.1 hypothetical protein SORBI_3006G234433 [Sorghum bicolor]